MILILDEVINKVFDVIIVLVMEDRRLLEFVKVAETALVDSTEEVSLEGDECIDIVLDGIVVLDVLFTGEEVARVVLTEVERSITPLDIAEDIDTLLRDDDELASAETP